MAIRIVGDQIADSAVSAAKIANGTIVPSKLNLSQVYAFTALPTVNADPSAANDLVRKQYVDGLVQGLSWKKACRVKMAGNVNLSSPGSTLDGISMASGDRVLCSAQTTGSENGIYVWNGAAAAMTRATDADAFSELQGAAVFITEGTAADSAYTQTAELTSFSGQTWTQFSGAGQIVAGDGLAKSGNTLSVNVDGSTLQIASDALKVKAGGITGTELNSSVAGNGLSGGAGSALSVSVDDSSLALSGNNVIIKASGVSTAKIADAAVTAAKLASAVAGDGLAGGAGSALSVNAGAGVAVASDQVQLNLQSLSAATVVAADSIAFLDATDNSTKKGTIADLAAGMAGVGLGASGGALALDLNELTAASVDVGNDSIAIIDANDSNSTRKESIADLMAATVANGLSSTSGMISVVVDGSSIEIDGGSGLRVKGNGITNSMIAGNAVQSAQIQDGAVGFQKLANLTSAQILVGNGTNRPTGVSISGDATLSNGGALTVANNAITETKLNNASVSQNKLVDNAVTITKLGARRFSESQTGSGSTTYDLGRAVDSNFFDGVQVYRNGMRCLKSGSPSDASEYSVSNGGAGGVCRITFGAAPNGDNLIFDYLT